MATNKEVALAWAKGEPAKAANFSTDGETAYSYGWHKIAETVNGSKIAIVCSYSITTRAKHVNPLLTVADYVVADSHTNEAGKRLVAGARS